MKRFKVVMVAAVILGLCTSAAVSAVSAQYNVVPNPFAVLINGGNAEVEGLNINGYTYLKLADMKATGLDVNFNETSRQVEISSSMVVLPVSEEIQQIAIEGAAGLLAVNPSDSLSQQQVPAVNSPAAVNDPYFSQVMQKLMRFRDLQYRSQSLYSQITAVKTANVSLFAQVRQLMSVSADNALITKLNTQADELQNQSYALNQKRSQQYGLLQQAYKSGNTVQINSINSEIDRINKAQYGLENTLSGIKQQVKELHVHVDSNITKLNQLQLRVDAVQNQIKSPFENDITNRQFAIDTEWNSVVTSLLYGRTAEAGARMDRLLSAKTKAFEDLAQILTLHQQIRQLLTVATKSGS